MFSTRSSEGLILTRNSDCAWFGKATVRICNHIDIGLSSSSSFIQLKLGSPWLKLLTSESIEIADKSYQLLLTFGQEERFLKD